MREIKTERESESEREYNALASQHVYKTTQIKFGRQLA